MKKVPQIEKTGISADYINEYVGKAMIFELNGIEKMLNNFKEYPIKKYTERFSSNDYCDVITKENKERVEELNRLAEICNSKDFYDLPKNDILEIMERAYCIIYGEKSEIFEYYKKL